jgi:tetratricopeptide (TPR) repeat protein
MNASNRLHRSAAFLLVALLCVLGAGPAGAAGTSSMSRTQAIEDLGKPNAAARRAAVTRLAEIGMMGDTPLLVQSLRDDDVTTRLLAENALWRVWSRSQDARIDQMFEHGIAQMQRGDAKGAIATFTRIVKRKPAFAEAWNKRATLYFMLGEYRKSLEDCAQTVRRNPNHFGALAGYAQNYLRLNQPELALDYFQRALEINPNMPNVESAIEDLQDEIEAKRDRVI